MNTIFGLFAQLNETRSSSARARSVLIGDQPAWPMALPRSRRVRHVGLGRLVQHPRLSEPIGHVPPAKYEQAYYRAHGTPMGGRSHVTKTSENRGRFNVSGIFSIDIPQIAGRSPFPDSP